MKQNLAKIVTKESILKALQKFEELDPYLEPSTKFDLEHNGNYYPPKEVVREAARIQGITIDDNLHTLNGGDKTNIPLRDLGFSIVGKNEPKKIIMKQKTLQDEFDEFENHGGCENWDWYQDLKKYSEVLQVLKLNSKKGKYNDYQSLNADYKILAENNEDFLDRYLFVSSNGFSTIRQQLVKNNRRAEILIEVNNNFDLLKKILTSDDKKAAFNLSKDLIQENCWTVIYRFLRALFPYDFTSVDAPNHFKSLEYTLFDEYSIKLLENDQINKNKEILNLINYKDIYKAQIFFWEYKDYNKKTIANDMEKSIPLTQPLNQILYGAPGTGKTYKTKELAVEIITGNKITDREELTKVYDELKENNQINFTTFHQSISYEDFVEGIKPKLNDNNTNEINYEIKDGIFKQLCTLDSKNVFSNLFYLGKRFENWEVKKVTLDSVYFEKPRGGILIMPLPLFLDLYKLIDELKVDFSSGNLHKDIEVDRVKYPFIERFYVNGYETLHRNIYQEYLKLIESTDFVPKKRVLIIDEINRGNVSAIFGELITLIEEDKRLGKKEALEVILPYSQTIFGVPHNLYIIGTMNTADRSVESLDTALRRRFSFVEMQPDLDVLQEEHITNGVITIDTSSIDMVNMLGIINKRIEILLNKDHKIGHSFFINISSFEELQLVFKDKIIPLLEEYFFGDFGKIGLVLGERFIKNTNTEKNDIFAKFDDYEDRGLLTDKLVYDIKNPMHIGAEHFIAIYE